MTKEERKEYMKKYYSDRRDLLNANNKAWQKENKEHLASYEKMRAIRDKDKIRARRKKRENERLRIDKQFALSKLARNYVFTILKGIVKSGKALTSLGCSVEELKTHIEKQFKPGMSWENWGLWEIDHIKPLSSFDLTDKEQFESACNFSNLQPLWKRENYLKGKEIL